MTRTFFVRRITIVAALLMPALVSADDTQKRPTTGQAKPADTKLSDADLHVLTDLHATNQMEIELGKLAKARAKAMKDYGQMLITDHTKADKDVLALAKARGVTLADHPTPQNELERSQHEKDMATMERLKTLDGTAFDKEFVLAMVEGHTRAIAKVDTATAKVADRKLKAMLVKVKPVLQKHLDRAKALEPPVRAAMR